MSRHIPQEYIRPLVVVWWYSSNIGVVLLNKYLLSNYGFKFPVFLTICHMFACTVLGQLSVSFGLVKGQNIAVSRHRLLRIGLLSAVFCFSVVAGNLSLKYIPVSFNQAIGATTPLFTALLSFVVLGAVEQPATYATLVPIVVGIVIASQFEPLFDLLGFLFALGAAASRALKTVLQGLLLSDEGGAGRASEKLNSMNLLRAMAPASLVFLLPVSLLLETGALASVAQLTRSHAAFLPLLLLNCLIAYSVNLSNFLVTHYTSPLTAQVLGNLKGVVATAVSVMIFHNPVTITGMIGYAITTAGCAMYSEAKKRGKKMSGESKKVDATNEWETSRLTSSNYSNGISPSSPSCEQTKQFNYHSVSVAVRSSPDRISRIA